MSELMAEVPHNKERKRKSVHGIYFNFRLHLTRQDAIYAKQTLAEANLERTSADVILM